MTKFFLKITDLNYKELLEKKYQTISEFKKLITELERVNFDFERLNEQKDRFKEYFESIELCVADTELCKQSVMGFRKKIIFANNLFFLTLKPCFHSQNPNLLYQLNYVFADFPKNLTNKTFRELKNPEDKNRLKLIQYFENFIKNIKSNVFSKGYYLFGPPNTGKTFLTALLMNKIILNKEAKVAFINSGKIIRVLKESSSYNNYAKELYKKLVTAKYLVIDNLGLEMMTSQYFGDFFFTLMTDRFNRDLTTFFLSTYSMTELKKNYTFSTAKIELVRVNAFFNLLKKMSSSFELKKQIKVEKNDKITY